MHSARASHVNDARSPRSRRRYIPAVSWVATPNRNAGRGEYLHQPQNIMRFDEATYYLAGMYALPTPLQAVYKLLVGGDGSGDAKASLLTNDAAMPACYQPTLQSVRVPPDHLPDSGTRWLEHKGIDSECLPAVVDQLQPGHSEGEALPKKDSPDASLPDREPSPVI